MMSPSIFDPMQSSEVKPLNKPELMELLIKGIPGTAGQTFKQKLETVFKRMPKIGSTARPEYLSHFFRGAVLTVSKTDLMEKLKITKIYLEKINPAALPVQKGTRVAFQIENGQEKILKLYLFAPTKDLKPSQHIHRESLQELISKPGVVECEIYGEIIHVNDEYEVNIFPMQVYDKKVLKGMDDIVRKVKADLSSGSERTKWEEVVKSDSFQSFEPSFLDLSSSDISIVKIATGKILQNMQDTYQAYPRHLLKTEAAYHAFLHGVFEMNFLYRYALTIRVEAILGVGEARGDLLFLSRLEAGSEKLTGGKSWDGIPGLIEVKARGISSSEGFDQIYQYLLNDLGLRTVQQRIVVSIYNPGLPKEEAIAIQERTIQSMKQDFIQEIFKLPLEHSIEAKIKLITALRKIVKDFSYLDQIIAGQLTVPFSMSSYNLLYNETLEDKLTTFIMSTNNMLVGLHLKKDSKVTIPLISAEINHIKQKLSLDEYIEIQVDINNLMDPERAITVEPISLNHPIALTTEQKEKLVEIKQFSFLNAQGTINQEGLRSSLWSVKNLINSERDFQMLLKGILMRSPQSVSLFLESNYAGLGRADIIAVFDHKIKVLELKYAEGGDDAKIKQQQAEKQLERYKNNFKLLTDKKKAQPVAMTFNKKGSSSKILLFKEEQGFTIDRTSSEESNSKSDYEGYSSLKELIARKNFRKNRLEKEVKKLEEEIPSEYISLKKTRLEAQLKICDLEIEMLKKHTRIHSLLNRIVTFQESFRKDLEEQLKKDVVEIAETIEKIESKIEDLDATEEMVGYKAKEELSQTLKKLQKKLVDRAKEGNLNSEAFTGVGLGAAILVEGAIGGGLVEKGAESIVAGSGVNIAEEIVESVAKETPESVVEKKGGETNPSKQVKRPTIRTKSVKKRKLCAANRRRRDLKSKNSQIPRDKSLFIEQENFSKISKALRALLGTNAGIRTLSPSWYIQLMDDGRDKEERNIFEKEEILGQSFLLGKESSYFSMLDKMTHVLSRDLDAFPLSADELRNFCECQREISREVPASITFSEPEMTIPYEDLNDVLNADTTNSWCKRLRIGEQEIFIRLSNGFYSCLDPKNIYIEQIQDSNHLQRVIYALYKFHLSLHADSKLPLHNEIAYAIKDEFHVFMQNIDLTRITQTFSHITDLPVFETEREQLQNQDEQRGKFNIHGNMVSRTMLYDLGLQIEDHTSSEAFDKTVEAGLTEEKLVRLFQEGKLSISVKNYIDILDQIDVFSEDELNAFIWLSQLPFRDTEHGWEIERISSLKAFVHQVSITEPLLVRYRLQLLRGTRSSQSLSSTVSFTNLASINLANEQPTIIENYTIGSLSLISLPASKREVELGIYENDLYFSKEKVSWDYRVSIQQFLVLKNYNKENSSKKIVIKDAEDQLWWPLIEKKGSNLSAQLIPFQAIHLIDSNVCLFSEQLQQEPRIAIETDSELIALQKGSDLLLIENKKKTLNQSKGLILKYFFREPKKWENLQIYIISTHECLTFKDINEQAKLAIELSLEGRDFLEENFVVEQPHLQNASGFAESIPCPKEPKCKPVYLDLTLNQYLAKIKVFKSHSTLDSKDEILKLRFVSSRTTPHDSTDDRSFPCPSVLRYQDLEISNLDAFNVAEVDSLQRKIDQAFLLKQSQLEWGQMLVDHESKSALMTLMVFLIIQYQGKNSDDYNLLSAYLGFSTKTDMLNFVEAYLEEYRIDDVKKILLFNNSSFKGSVWLVTRALLHEQNVFGSLHPYFKSLLPKELLTKIKEKVLNTLNMEKYSDLHSSIKEFIEFHEKEKDFSSKIKHHIRNIYKREEIEQLLGKFKEDRSPRITREAVNPPVLLSDRFQRVANLEPNPLPTSGKYNRIGDRRLQRVNREVDMNIHAISSGLRLLCYFFGRFKFVQRMQKAEYALLKSNLKSQDFTIEQCQANLQATIDKLENKSRSYSSYFENILKKLG